MNKIRKITVGKEYKENSMHFSVGQPVYDDHCICDIQNIEEENVYRVYITKNNEVMPWKDFNKNMGISVEYDLKY
jgi:hypothetical protein